MNTQYDNRTALMWMLEELNEPDVQLLLAFTAGFEAGKSSSQPEIMLEKINKFPGNFSTDRSIYTTNPT